MSDVIVLWVFLKRIRCPPHHVRRTSPVPTHLYQVRSTPLHILHIRCWGFEPRVCNPNFPFLEPINLDPDFWSVQGQKGRFACAGRMSVLTPIATKITICV